MRFLSRRLVMPNDLNYANATWQKPRTIENTNRRRITNTKHVKIRPGLVMH